MTCWPNLSIQEAPKGSNVLQREHASFCNVRFGPIDRDRLMVNKPNRLFLYELQSRLDTWCFLQINSDDRLQVPCRELLPHSSAEHAECPWAAICWRTFYCNLTLNHPRVCFGTRRMCYTWEMLIGCIIPAHTLDKVVALSSRALELGQTGERLFDPVFASAPSLVKSATALSVVFAEAPPLMMWTAGRMGITGHRRASDGEFLYQCHEVRFGRRRLLWEKKPTHSDSYQSSGDVQPFCTPG